MSILRRDDTCSNTLGTVVPGTKVYYLGPQPVNVDALTPLLTVYSDTSGTVTTNPQVADGFGHAVAYLNANGQLFTCVYVFPNGSKVVYPDQSVGSVGTTLPTTFAGVPSGTIDGSNAVFTIAVAASPQFIIVWQNNVIGEGLGYTASWSMGILTITYATPPTTGDFLYVQGWY